MSISDVALRVEQLYRETVLTKGELDRFRDAFTRLEDKVEKLIEIQVELKARLAVAERRADEVMNLRDRMTELEARFKSTLDHALMVSARESVAQAVNEYLKHNIRDLLLPSLGLARGSDGDHSGTISSKSTSGDD